MPLSSSTRLFGLHVVRVACLHVFWLTRTCVHIAEKFHEASFKCSPWTNHDSSCTAAHPMQVADEVVNNLDVEEAPMHALQS